MNKIDMWEPTEEQTQQLVRLFGRELPEEGPVREYLQKCGWQPLRDGFFQKPRGRAVTDEEWTCLQYLIDAFGYSGMRFGGQ